jgi:hypothetical protein
MNREGEFESPASILSNSLSSIADEASRRLANIRSQLEQHRSNPEMTDVLRDGFDSLLDTTAREIARAVGYPTEGPAWIRQLFRVALPLKLMEHNLGDPSVGEFELPDLIPWRDTVIRARGEGPFNRRVPVDKRAGPHQKISGLLGDLLDLKADLREAWFAAQVEAVCSRYDAMEQSRGEGQAGPGVQAFRDELAIIFKYAPQKTGYDDQLWSLALSGRISVELYNRVLAIAHRLDTEGVMNTPQGHKRGRRPGH